MIVLANIYESAGVFVAGAAIGLLLWRWIDRAGRAAQVLKSKSLLENARREAETVLRDARLAANNEALKLREFIRVGRSQGLDPIPSTTAHYAAYLKAETDKWAKVVRAAKIELQ